MLFGKGNKKELENLGATAYSTLCLQALSPANITPMGLLWKPGLRLFSIPCCLFVL